MIHDGDRKNVLRWRDGCGPEKQQQTRESLRSIDNDMMMRGSMSARRKTKVRTWDRTPPTPWRRTLTATAPISTQRFFESHTIRTMKG